MYLPKKMRFFFRAPPPKSYGRGVIGGCPPYQGGVVGGSPPYNGGSQVQFQNGHNLHQLVNNLKYKICWGSKMF